MIFWWNSTALAQQWADGSDFSRGAKLLQSRSRGLSPPSPPHFNHWSCDEWVLSKWVWSGSREQFIHCGLRKFRHSKSSVYRWYPQLARGRFVYDTYRTMEATRMRHGWVHMFITHCPTVTLQLHNFHLFRTCRTSVVSALLRGNWQDFNWHDASRGPSAIAELFLIKPNIVTKFIAYRPMAWILLYKCINLE